jgi:hypothetical protein
VDPYKINLVGDVLLSLQQERCGLRKFLLDHFDRIEVRNLAAPDLIQNHLAVSQQHHNMSFFESNQAHLVF